jgi:hypothetical protein
VIAREYEVGQLAQILQVIPPQSPLHGEVLKAIIGHLNITSKEDLLNKIEAAAQPNPQAQQMQQQQAQLQMALQQAQIEAIKGQAAESGARAKKYQFEADLMPQELTLKYSDMDKDGKVDDDFERKLALGKMLLEEDRWAVEKMERESAMQGQEADRERQAADQDILRQMMQQQGQDLSQVTFEEEPMQ